MIDVTSTHIANFIARQDAINNNDYSAYIELLYNELIRCFTKLEGEANQHFEKDETGISSTVAMYLTGARYPCISEANSNGHVDLSIEEGDFKWLGEAKIHRGNKWTYHGFQQLVANYSTGRPNHCRGSIIVYNKTKQKNSVDCAEEWKTYIEDKESIIECEDYSPDGYIDMVLPKHCRSGRPYYIRSFFVNLQYTPSDKYTSSDVTGVDID